MSKKFRRTRILWSFLVWTLQKIYNSYAKTCEVRDYWQTPTHHTSHCAGAVSRWKQREAFPLIAYFAEVNTVVRFLRQTFIFAGKRRGDSFIRFCLFLSGVSCSRHRLPSDEAAKYKERPMEGSFTYDVWWSFKFLYHPSLLNPMVKRMNGYRQI